MLWLDITWCVTQLQQLINPIANRLKSRLQGGSVIACIIVHCTINISFFDRQEESIEEHNEDVDVLSERIAALRA